MPDREQLYVALRNADAAGDVEGAKKLASYIQTMSPAATATDKPVNPTEGNSFLDNATAGVGKAFTDIGLGAKQGLDDAAAFLERKLGGQGINAALGMKNADQIQRETQAEVDDKRKLDAPLMATGGGKVGNFVGQAIPAVAASLAPGGQGLAGSMLIGAGMGAVEPRSGDETILKNAAIGATGGAAGYGVAKGLSRVINPASMSNPELQMLKAEGVNPTIGQTLGGMANSVEQKLQSVPILGDSIGAARRRAMNDFNNAAINRATEPIGVKIQGTGHDAVKAAGDALSQAYDKTLAKVPFVQLDAQFGQDIAQIGSAAKTLVPTMQDKLDKVLTNLVTSRMSSNNTLSGDAFKTIDSELTQLASKWKGSMSASESELGDIIGQVKDALGQTMRRNNPAVSKELDAIDIGWANLVRVEAAAKSAKNTEGVFSPAQLNMAVQSTDQSARKRAVSRGTALMQDLGSSGQSILGGTVPDSGTAGRLALMGSSGIASYFINPAIPAALGAGAAAYTKPVQGILNSVIGSRPAAAAPLADAVSQYASTMGAAGTTLTMSKQREANMRAMRSQINAQKIAKIGQATTVDQAIQAAAEAVK